MTRAAIAASIAFDTIMVFEGKFTDHILPDQIHKINLSFLSPRMRREYGGCAGNIAYNYRLIGGQPVPMGMVGNDFAPYRTHMEALGIDQSGVHEKADHYTAQCFIVTDLHNNQLTGFHPGAMGLSAEIDLKAAGQVACGLVGPDPVDAMQAHVAQMADSGLPFIFDPGQNIILFDGPDLMALVDRSPVLVCNDYEAELICKKANLTITELAARVPTLIVTRGEEGSVVYEQGRFHTIKPVPATQVKDPTGCGDAYRAGLLLALAQGRSLLEGAQLGSVLGSIKIASLGCQNHRPSMGEIRGLYQTHFGPCPF